MTDAEMIEAVIHDRRVHSLETISITRGQEGSYALTSYRGVSIFSEREAMLRTLEGILDIQDTNFDK